LSVSYAREVEVPGEGRFCVGSSVHVFLDPRRVDA
jgi:hypothetical protein